MSQTPDPGQTHKIQAVSTEMTGKIACARCGLHLGAGTAVCPNDGTVLVDLSALAPKLSGEYEFITEIGSGGMGVIYKARHLALNQIVAIKMLHANRLTEASFLRFQQEARAISSLDHPGIVRVRDFGVTESGQPHLILDFIQGQTLAEHISAGGPLAVSDAIDIFIDVADALEHAHERGILHRDLKPSNIMLIENKGRFVVKIVDFGIAKMLDQQEGIAARGLTQTGELFGSPLYMSPEQASGETLDFRADIYSLGCVFFEALTGTPPFSSTNMIEVLFQQINDAPPTLKEASLGKTFPPELEMLVGKALRKNRSHRFTSVSEFKDALIETRLGKRHKSLVDGGKISAEPLGNDAKAKESKLDKDSRLILICASSLVVLIVGLAVWSYFKMTESLPLSHEQEPVLPNAFEKLPRTDDAVRQKILSSTRQKKIVIAGWITDEALTAFDQCKITEDVDLTGTGINGEGLAHLIHLPLRKLNLRESECTDVALLKIGQMTDLEELNIRGIHFGESNLEQLKNLTALRELNVVDDKIGHLGIEAIVKIPSLQSLNIEGNPGITTVEIALIGTLPDLKELSLSQGQFESFLMTAKNFKTLENLSVRKGDIVKLGENILSNLEAVPLQVLQLHHVKMTAAQFLSLAKLTKLKNIQLSDCSAISEAMLADLGQLRPDLKIQLVKEVDKDKGKIEDGDF